MSLSLGPWLWPQVSIVLVVECRSQWRRLTGFTFVIVDTVQFFHWHRVLLKYTHKFLDGDIIHLWVLQPRGNLLTSYHVRELELFNFQIIFYLSVNYWLYHKCLEYIFELFLIYYYIKLTVCYTSYVYRYYCGLWQQTTWNFKQVFKFKLNIL